MTRSTVYFTNMRATPEMNLLKKFRRLIEKAGIADINFEKQFAAIKIHLGEPGNIAYLRPNFSKVVADKIKELGGKPFLTDCNTLYVGRRKDALEHLEAAYENGYNPFCTDCHVIIADGLKGTDEALVPVEGGEYIKEAKIGRAIADADVIVSLTHFKGHELTGFGGAVKNLGMGSGSRGGKMEMHSDGKPSVDEGKCIGCGRCIGACPFDAVQPDWEGSEVTLCRKMAEYAKAVIDGKPHFHIAAVVDVSPFCDCHAENDAAVVPNIGFFASHDPVALDQACADAVMKAPVVENSYLADQIKKNGAGADHFHTIHPDTHWQATLEHAEKIGIGTREYELKEI